MLDAELASLRQQVQVQGQFRTRPAALRLMLRHFIGHEPMSAADLGADDTSQGDVLSNDRSEPGAGPAAPQGPTRNTLDTDGMLSEWDARLFFRSPSARVVGAGASCHC